MSAIEDVRPAFVDSALATAIIESIENTEIKVADAVDMDES